MGWRKADLRPGNRYQLVRRNRCLLISSVPFNTHLRDMLLAGSLAGVEFVATISCTAAARVRPVGCCAKTVGRQRQKANPVISATWNQQVENGSGSPSCLTHSPDLFISANQMIMILFRQMIHLKVLCPRTLEPHFGWRIVKWVSKGHRELSMPLTACLPTAYCLFCLAPTVPGEVVDP